MKLLRVWMSRLAGLLPNSRREQELADELESHLQMHVADNLRQGMTPEQARRDAFLKLGGIESTKEGYRDRSSVPFLENLLQEARFAARQLRKSPGFTSTAIFMLALGICASVAIFAFVDAALIKPLPYQNPTRLVGVFETIASICPHCTLSYPDYIDWKKSNQVFQSLDVYKGAGFILTTRGYAQHADAARISGGFFHTLGISPILGRDFYAGEDLPGKPRTAVISYSAWQTRFHTDKNVLGQAVELSGNSVTIIGVLPQWFHFAPVGAAEFWVPIDTASECDQRRSCHDLWGVARLKDGVSVETALAEVTSIAKQLERQYPASNHGQGATVAPFSDVILGHIRPILLTLLGGAGLLLVIASVNVASLLLVRSESRKREMAVRSAMGASRNRLIRQFVTEGLVLVAVGSVLGVTSAYWAMLALKKLISANMLDGMPYLNGLGLTGHVLVFAAGLAFLAALVFAVTPVATMRTELREGLTEGSRGSAGNTWRRLGSKLVVLELATAVVLLVGAGLLGKSLYRLLHVDIGFQADHIAMVALAAPNSYSRDEQAVTLGRKALSRAENLTGVKSAAIEMLGGPLAGNGNTDWIRFLGRPFHGEHNEVNERHVSGDYFTTLRTRLLRGRYFTDFEDASKPHVVIINDALAKKFFPGEDPIGKQFGDDDLSPKSMKQIVGVVDDIREGSLDSDIWPAEYIPFNQSPASEFTVFVRTAQSKSSLLLSLESAMHAIDPEVIAGNAITMDNRINESAYLHRTTAWLVGGFAAVALLLSVVGLYGVVAYSVSQRTREIGVRMALGASTRLVHQLVLKEAGWLAAFGIVIGIVCSVAAATLIRTMLFGVSSWDLETLAAVAGVLGVAALLASYIPARRAALVNPIEALRTE